MPAQHLAGFPVEEMLLAALAAAAPMIALVGWEIRDRVRRVRRKLSGTAPGAVPEAGPDPAAEVR
ncbi:hypothetical protein [Kribbella sp. CA-293567]|uniref:hypothetical protein n=1 Tax=Kribbella sp. CA-293567 TaxID=3002436 RepID=UPI0022DE33D6|nr:hypothetical protein [Kribbella sp. CA-293567]WBQ04935.1 hypothetical protein OX958_33905 [Kribbella sp. CA-293567]